MAKSKLVMLNAATLISTLNGLVQERENFEKEEYARSNKRLYAILTEIYKNYLLIKESKEELKDAVRKMTAKLKEEGGKVQTTTVVLTLFVRYVFRTDRQRAFNYSRTLQAAIAKGIKPEQLMSFIEGEGGVEECKRTLSKKPETLAREKSIQETLPLVDERFADTDHKLAELKVDAEWVANTHDKDLTLLVGTSDKKGNLRIVSVVPSYSKGMSNWAKKQIAIFLLEQQVESKKKEKETRKKDALKAAIEKPMKNNSATETVGELLAA
jgi:hypothetical protein